jgi:hypothetical protein
MCLCGTGSLKGPLSILHMIHEWIWSSGGMILTGENRRTRKKTCPSATLSTTNPTRTNLGAKPSLRRSPSYVVCHIRPDCRPIHDQFIFLFTPSRNKVALSRPTLRSVSYKIQSAREFRQKWRLEFLYQYLGEGGGIISVCNMWQWGSYRKLLRLLLKFRREVNPRVENETLWKWLFRSICWCFWICGHCCLWLSCQPIVSVFRTL